MTTSNQAIQCLIDYEDPYVQPLIISAFQSRLPPNSYKLISSLDEYAGGPLLQFRAYEALDFAKAVEGPADSLINAYVFRKALIRKHYLATTCANWVVKHPESALKTHVKPSVDFELDYAEFLDDALVEAFELRESFARNEGVGRREEREWWILKPGMSDRGQGIRLFSSEEELLGIFEEWEAERPDSEDEEDERDDDVRSDRSSTTPPPANQITAEKKDYIVTSHLRHFIAQAYIHPPLAFDGRKFHIRTYVLAVGALRVYVYRPMLALFAAAPYAAPWSSAEMDGQPDLRAHLTNTCLQGSDEREGSVRSFWDLPDAPDPSFSSFPSSSSSSSTTTTTTASPASSALPAIASDWKPSVFSQICSVTGEVFEAAARGMMIHFQPLPTAFELFGVDFMVDETGVAWLLEINAFPDFRQTGDELAGLVEGLFEEVADVAVKPFFGMEGGKGEGTQRLVKVLDVDLGRR